MELYWVWLMLAVVCVFVEMMTSGVAVICFAVGALAAMVVSFFDVSFNWQLFAMMAGSLVGFVGIRPFALRYLNRKKEFMTNADAVVGRVGVVSEVIDAASNSGRVAIDGDDWKAISSDGTVIGKGSRVTVVSRDSLVVTVSKVD